MKKIIFTLAIFSALAITSCKENAAEKVSNEKVTEAADRDANAGKVAAIEFTEKEFDFGKIKRGTKVEHVFKFKNTGEVPLIIASAKSSCGCTIPTPPKDPIAPGEEGELLVKYNGSGKNQVTKTVTVVANTASGKEMIKIKAFVEAPEGGAPVKKIVKPKSK
ncbi:MAG: DUF1573 domain-containing protein [Flavobacteriales bacterium]